MTFECYSQRLLNPFRGCVNCIRYRSADAVSADGIHWDIYVSNEDLLKDLPPGHRPLVNDIRFGRWSAAQGLRRGPVFPSDDFLLMERMGQAVYEHLLTVHDQVPFPFLDVCELWLLDTDRQPLALLDSALQAEDINRAQSLRWLPGQNCRHTFVTSTADRLGLDGRQPGAVADYLGRYINSRTAQPAAAQLFRRNADGSGTGLSGINLDAALATRTLPAREFPDQLLDRQHHDTLHRQLVDDFIRWQAPWQLLLPDLDPQQRGEFEQHARTQPLKVAAQYRLYPDIEQPELIEAARVEARLRATLPQQDNPDQVMSTDYIELGTEPAR